MKNLEKYRKLFKQVSLLLAFTVVFSLLAPIGGLGFGLPAASASDGNLIVNGGFETGDLTGWDTSGNSKFKVTDQEKRSGDYALEIGGPQNWNGIKYTVDVYPNTDYILTFWGKGPGGAAYKVLRASDEATMTEDYTGTHDDWHQYTVQFNTGDVSQIKIYVSDANGTTYYDDFVLTRVLKNLVVNGGFETGDLTGWDTSGNDKFKVTDQEKRSGNYALEISGPQNWNGIKYTVDVIPDTDYTLTFWGKGAGGAAYKVLRASDELVLAENYTGTHDDWHQYTLPFNSGSASQIKIYVSDAGNTAWYDDFYIGDPVVTILPKAENVSISGVTRVTYGLAGSFDYYHWANTPEGYSMYQWFQADSPDGEFEPIPRGFGETFVLTDQQVGKYIKLQVTPVDSSGVAGEPVWSGNVVGPVQPADPADRLRLEIEDAQRMLAESVMGDGVAQYPAAAWNAFEQAIADAEDVLASGDVSEQDIVDLQHAKKAFDDARIRLPSGFTEFITVDGTRLMEGDKEFRFISFNYPGALFNEDEGGILPTEFEMEDAIRTIKQAGGKVFRTYTLTVRDKDDPPNKPRHIEGPGILGEDAFEAMDRLLMLANKHGVRVIIPFIDNWDWPPGGITDFARFRGLERLEFYEHPQLIEDFKRVIEQVLNRINRYTGVRYKDDPAILGWETGNELMTAPEWMSEIAAFYKSINKNQLLISGNQMELPHFYRNITPEALADPNIDVVKSHYYEGNYANRVEEDKALATAAGKPFFVGEYGFKPTSEFEAFLNKVIENGTSGALIWSLRPHSNKGGFVQHTEYEVGGILYQAYHWPGLPSGDYQDSTNVLKLLREKAYEIQGMDVPPMPAPEPEPVLFNTDSVTKLSWKGSTGARSYTIERAEDPAGPWEVLATGVLDDMPPGGIMYADRKAVSGKAYYYRVKGVNEGGESGYSNVIGPVTAKYVLDDASPNQAQKYYAESGAVVYRVPNDILNFAVKAQKLAGDGDFEFYLSADGVNFRRVNPVQTADGYELDTIPLAGANQLKIVYPDGNKDNGSITRVTIEYLGDGTALEPVEPLLDSGVIRDELDNLNYIFSLDGNLAQATDNADKAGGDASRLVRTDDGDAHIVYRSQGDMKAFKLESYHAGEPAEDGHFRFFVSSDGVEYEEIEPDIDLLGGEWFKVNYQAAELPAGTKFLKVAFPQGGEAGYPQISRVQIAVGQGKIALPGPMPAHVIDDGDRYGGEELLLVKAYELDAGSGQAELALDPVNKSAGDYGIRLSFTFGGGDDAIGLVKALDAADRSRYDTLQFWVKPDSVSRELTVELRDESGATWSKTVTVSGAKGYYVNLPLNAKNLDLTRINRFALRVSKGSANTGVLVLDDIRFVQTRVIDTFDSYDRIEDFLARYGTRNTGGGQITATLTDEVSHEGFAMKLDFDMTGPGYAGLITQLPHVNWSAYDTLSLWVQPGPNSHTLTLQVKTGSNEYFETTLPVTGGSEAAILKIPFADFDYPSWYGGHGTLDPTDIIEFNIYVGQTGPAAGYLYLDSIVLLNESGEDEEPGDGDGPGGPGGGNPGGGIPGGVTTQPEPQPDEGVSVVDDLESENGRLVVELAGDVKELRVPADLGELESGQPLVIRTAGVEIEIPSEVLSMLKAQLAAGDAAEASLYVAFERVDQDEASELLSTAADQSGAALNPAGPVYRFGLGVLGGDGERLPATSFNHSIRIAFPLNDSVDRELVGVYFLADDGTIEYVGGEIEGDRIVAEVTHFSVYAPLEYRKTFVDVPEGFWAERAIARLVAKHVVKGVSDTQFAPFRNVTRAEFAALLVRALGLEARGSAAFEDVRSDAWYAKDVAAAVEAGIVTGRSATVFDPEAVITREEMAVMVMRAYAFMTGADHEAKRIAPFADRDAAGAWARGAIDAAYDLGLILGKGQDRFDPKGQQTRAESVQVIDRLLLKR